MTRERIEDFREIVLPFLSRTLLETNYENLGRSDAEEFEKDFNEILNLAIKALEQEPCEDCISRQAVLDYIDKMPSELTTDGRRMIRQTTLKEYISDNLPPVPPKSETVTEFADRCRECGSKYGRLLRQDRETGRWIPVSERLPEADGRYLCTYEDDIEENCVDFGSYKNGEWYVDKVIAWMPLPAPFESQESEKIKQ